MQYYNLPRIFPERRQTAIRLLQLLAYAKRPLQLDELSDAMVIDLRMDPSFHTGARMLIETEYLLDYCPSLVIREESNDIDFDWTLTPPSNCVETVREEEVMSRKKGGARERYWFSCRELNQSVRIFESTSRTQVRLAHFSVTEYLRSHNMRADLRETFE